MATALGTYLGEQAKAQKSLTSTQGLNPGTISSYFVFADYKFKIKLTKIIVEKQSMAPDASIWGLSKWGEKNWSSPNSFILGHSDFGVLGKSMLGGALEQFEIVEQKILTQSIPDIARKEVVKWLAGDEAKYPSYISVGNGDTSYNSGDLSLSNEIARKSVTADISEDKVAKYVLTILSTDDEFQGKTLTEVGLNVNNNSFYKIIDVELDSTKQKDLNTTVTWTGNKEIIFN